MTTREKILDLRRRSTHMGRIVLPRRPFQSERPKFHELKYFFGEGGGELGYVTFEHRSYEAVTLFDTPRVWDEKMKSRLQIQRTFVVRNEE